jgi:hypothetical protein
MCKTFDLTDNFMAKLNDNILVDNSKAYHPINQQHNAMRAIASGRGIMVI